MYRYVPCGVHCNTTRVQQVGLIAVQCWLAAGMTHTVAATAHVLVPQQ
jgi:hypothetical protein